jgi:hypothetical protein
MAHSIGHEVQQGQQGRACLQAAQAIGATSGPALAHYREGESCNRMRNSCYQSAQTAQRKVPLQHVDAE